MVRTLSRSVAEKKQDIPLSEALSQAIENDVDNFIRFIFPGDRVHKNGRIRQERTSTWSVQGQFKGSPPIGYHGTPEDMAALDVCLASDQSSYTMSHVNLVDGEFRLSPLFSFPNST
ncbi:hypothetical protein DC522_18135 [Microvirga sp. KLBC 81]|nr:hypothetical protein DC522_18135 [Microvirga sp. KLBC 81]